MSFRRWSAFLRTIFKLILVALAILAAVVYAPDKVRAVLKDAGWVGEFVSAVLPPPLPVAKRPSKAYWLTQNWSARQRFWFHHETQGTATFPVPYDWFVSLEQAELSIFSKPALLIDENYLNRFGFIPSPRKLDGSASDFGYREAPTTPQVEWEQFKDFPENPDGLPVGFAKLPAGLEPASGEPYPAQLGFTCAACHTGHIRYRDVSIRFDGGPAMVNLGDLESAIGLSIFYTVYVPTRFDRFADRVMDRAAKTGSPPTDRDAFKASLKKQLQQVLDKIKRERDWGNEILARANMTDIDEGFGRLDALNRIGNQVFFSDLLPPVAPKQTLPEELARNYARPDAPVSFPPIWDVPWFLWAQYDASILNELVRNAGESLGVKTKLNLTVHADANRPLFKSSMQMKNIFWIEEMLRGPDPFADNAPGQAPHFKGLIAPRWDEAANLLKNDPAWQVDPAKVSNGRALYAQLCVECHRGPVNDAEFDKQWPDRSFWRTNNPDRANNWVKIGDRSFFNVVQKPVAAMGTDGQQSRVLAGRQVYLPPWLDLSPIDQLNAQWSCDLPAKDEALNASFGLALMAVVGKSIDQWFKDNPTPADLEKAMRGPRPNCQNKQTFKPIAAVDGKPANPPIVVVPHYRARPLDGVWATAPYLHNGSVPTLYDMLTPQHQRPRAFCVGSREFDPVKVGLAVETDDKACATGLTRFDVTGLGNSNLGHSFEGTETDKTKLPNGIIGRELSPVERDALVQYLKTL
jgi:hypothetical protein